jgi:hypothetical protein
VTGSLDVPRLCLLFPLRHLADLEAWDGRGKEADTQNLEWHKRSHQWIHELYAMQEEGKESKKHTWVWGPQGSRREGSKGSRMSRNWTEGKNTGLGGLDSQPIWPMVGAGSRYAGGAQPPSRSADGCLSVNNISVDRMART